MSNLTQRLIVAAIGIPALIALVLAGGNVYFGVIALTALWASREFVFIARRAQARPSTVILSLAAAFYVVDAGRGEGAAAAITGLVLTAALCWGAFRLRQPNSITDVVWTVGGALYTGFLFSHWLLLRRLDIQGTEWVFLALFATFANDTAAYAVGRIFGRHKMAPSISPGKTWEGAFGALAVTTVAMPGLAALLALPVAWHLWLLGPLLSVSAQAGDLLESKLKRIAGVKDSSGLLPGHGGLLDRLDALVFVGPLVYYYCIWVLPLH